MLPQPKIPHPRKNTLAIDKIKIYDDNMKKFFNDGWLMSNGWGYYKGHPMEARLSRQYSFFKNRARRGT